jgi:hypothetical protein
VIIVERLLRAKIARNCHRTGTVLLIPPGKVRNFSVAKTNRWGICPMHRLGESAVWALAMASLALLAGACAWMGYGSAVPIVAMDYEACADEARTNVSSNVEYSKLVTHCGERFAGRRKSGGGYTYFDFMQNKTFDIAGPNPTESERKQIDHAYMEFLGTARRETILSEPMKAQANLEQAGIDRSRQNAGPPLSLTRRIPVPAKRSIVDRSKPCEDGSLSCGWAKLSATVRSAFASANEARRQ